MAEELEKAAREFQDVLDGLDKGVDANGGQLLDAHLARDSEIPSVYNGAALAAHRANHDNAGAYLVIHANTHPAADVGKAMALSAPPDARLFRRGGPNFVAWLHDGPAAELFNQHLRLLAPNIVTGVGSSYERADAALRSGGGGDELHTSFLGSAPEPGWKPGRESVKDARQRGLKNPGLGDSIQGIPGHDTLFSHAAGATPQGYEHPEQPLEKAELQANPALFKHPILSGRQFDILSAEHPRFPTLASGHDALRTCLQRRGIPHEEIQGFYDRPKRSMIIYDTPLQDVCQLARDFGQETFIHGGAGGSAPILVYTNGPHADSYHPSNGYNFWNKQPGNYWNKLGPPEQPLYSNLNVDWSQRVPLQRPNGGKPQAANTWGGEEQSLNLDAYDALAKAEPKQPGPSYPQAAPVPFDEVHPSKFESAIQKQTNIGALSTDRDYEGKKTFLSPKGTSGYALHHNGEISNVFSLVPGEGAHAVRHAIANGGWHLDTFDSKLVPYYGQFGFKITRREPNWTPGGPDVVWMALKRNLKMAPR